MIISYHAIDLIQQLLQRKEFRLSSREYKTNDCALWHGMRIPIHKSASDPRSSHYRGSPVYSNDASDIKAHRFFRHIPWDEMLHHQPPYIPEAKIWGDSNCCDKENLGFFDGVIPQEKQTSVDVSVPAPDPLALLACQNIAQDNEAGKAKAGQNTTRKHKNKEKKRARDKILRDAVIGPTALDVRTKAAFVGYTWRRPKSVRNVLEIERGRGLVSDRF